MKGGDHMQGCGCHGHHDSKGNVCPSLWSKEKKIRMLENQLEPAKTNVQEIETLITELKAEK